MPQSGEASTGAVLEMDPGSSEPPHPLLMHPCPPFTHALPTSWMLLTCRELWYRASLALQTILAAEPGRRILVVAHNAVNQALIGVSLGLPPSAFRRLVQANAATTLLEYRPAAGAAEHDAAAAVAGAEQNGAAAGGTAAAAAADGRSAAAGRAGARATLRHLNQSPVIELLLGPFVSFFGVSIALH